MWVVTCRELWWVSMTGFNPQLTVQSVNVAVPRSRWNWLEWNVYRIMVNAKSNGGVVPNLSGFWMGGYPWTSDITVRLIRPTDVSNRYRLPRRTLDCTGKEDLPMIFSVRGIHRESLGPDGHSEETIQTDNAYIFSPVLSTGFEWRHNKESTPNRLLRCIIKQVPCYGSIFQDEINPYRILPTTIRVNHPIFISPYSEDENRLQPFCSEAYGWNPWRESAPVLFMDQDRSQCNPIFCKWGLWHVQQPLLHAR